MFGQILRRTTQASLRKSGKWNCLTTSIRNSHWHYREPQPATATSHKLAEAMGTLMWGWIFWHIFTDYGHLIGHFHLPDPKTFTNAELGIPPDDE